MSKGRAFVFTMNNPDKTGDVFLEELKVQFTLKYAIFQLEKGENGTPHFQGYVELKNPCAWTSIGKMMAFCCPFKNKFNNT